MVDGDPMRSVGDREAVEDLHDSIEWNSPSSYSKQSTRFDPDQPEKSLVNVATQEHT
jgi:hypothetical protein